MTEARRETAGIRHRAEGESGGLAAGRHAVANDTPDRIRQLTRTLVGTHWTYQDRIRDILSWVCSTDRQYARAEREWMKVATGQEQAIRGALAQAFRARAPEEDGGAPTPR